MFLILDSKIKNVIFSFYIFIFSFLIKKSNNYIVLPFRTTNLSSINSNETTDNLIQELLYKLNIDKIYTQVSLGNPSNSIDFYFSMEEFITSIDSNICLKNSKSSYNPSKSKSYKNIQNDFNSKLSNEKCSIYKDLDLSENITFNTFDFYLRENYLHIENNQNKNLIENNKYCGTIGLRRFSENNIFDKNSFIYNLKKYNIINSYSWGIFFFNSQKLYNIEDDTQDQYDGFFIAGVTSEDNIDIFDTEFICNVYAEEESLYWSFYFDRIFYYEKINGTNEYISTNNTRVELIVDLNYIISDEQYYKDVKKIYFQKYFDNNTCYESKSFKEGEGYTYMIICNINFKDCQKSFPNIYFYSEQLFFAFSLYSEDVFFEYNNKIYFLIVYKDSIKDYWKLGKIFLKKYPFMFDYDKKIISYVHLKKVWNQKKHTKKKKPNLNNARNNNKKINNIKEYILLVLLVVGILIGLYFGRRIWNKKNKLKAKELEESYKYFAQENLKVD